MHNSPDNHSLDKMSQFTSYLRLLFLSEVKYGECFLPAGEKKLRAAHWRSPVDKYRLFLSFQAMMSLVSPKVWPSLISINHRGTYPQISFKLVGFAWKAHELVVSIYLCMVATTTGSLMWPYIRQNWVILVETLHLQTLLANIRPFLHKILTSLAFKHWAA